MGPSGTYTEQALLSQPDLAAADTRPIGSIPDVLNAVVEGEVDLAFVPIENAIEGRWPTAPAEKSTESTGVKP